MENLWFDQKGQSIVEYLLLIAVLALGFIVGGKYLRNIIKSRSEPSQYEAFQNWDRKYVANEDRWYMGTDITAFTNGTPTIGTDEKKSW